MGHTLATRANMGDVHAIWIDPKTGTRSGASDPRMDGVTLGY
jgi:gamma-glutamyltranspeptidase